MGLFYDRPPPTVNSWFNSDCVTRHVRSASSFSIINRIVNYIRVQIFSSFLLSFAFASSLLTMNQNNGVSLRGMPSKRRKNRHHKHNQQPDHPDHSEKPTDTQSNAYSSEERGLARGSAIGSSNSPLSSQLENEFDTPMQYDATGKPFVAHGTETFGDIMLHPTQQYHLHKQRMENYKREVETWETNGEKPIPAALGIQPG
jgi:hypothetical protein